MKTTSVLARMRQICLSLPDTKETLTWGEPHFRVGDKIFAGCGEEKGRPVIGFKLDMDHADAILADPRFSRAPYVGHKGWVSMDASQVADWEEVRPLLLESYRLIAAKRTLARLDGGTRTPPATNAGRTKTPSRTPARRPARRKTAARSRPRRP
jgi:predicted DNA-binding protein (MmcQ/YjbR family)